MERLTRDEYYIEMARLTAKRSTCASKQVGGVLIDQNGRIIQAGYNGVGSGQIHCCDLFRPEKLKNKFDGYREKHHQFNLRHELHCEENILAYCAKNGTKTDNSILYTTMSPCLACAKSLLVAGVKKIIYDNEYDLDKEGLKFLRENGVECTEWKGM